MLTRVANVILMPRPATSPIVCRAKAHRRVRPTRWLGTVEQPQRHRDGALRQEPDAGSEVRAAQQQREERQQHDEDDETDDGSGGEAVARLAGDRQQPERDDGQGELGEVVPHAGHHGAESDRGCRQPVAAFDRHRDADAERAAAGERVRDRGGREVGHGGLADPDAGQHGDGERDVAAQVPAGDHGEHHDLDPGHLAQGVPRVAVVGELGQQEPEDERDHDGGRGRVQRSPLPPPHGSLGAGKIVGVQRSSGHDDSSFAAIRRFP